MLVMYPKEIPLKEFNWKVLILTVQCAIRLSRTSTSMYGDAIITSAITACGDWRDRGVCAATRSRVLSVKEKKFLKMLQCIPTLIAALSLVMKS